MVEAFATFGGFAFLTPNATPPINTGAGFGFTLSSFFTPAILPPPPKPLPPVYVTFSVGGIAPASPKPPAKRGGVTVAFNVPLK